MATYRPESNLAQDVHVVYCKYCVHFKAEYHCKNCRDNMCSRCHDKHIRSFSFKKHITVPYNERQFAGVHCMEHPTQFYSSGCKDCNTPICPECKVKYHLTHKGTSIAKVCVSARKKIMANLKQMKARRLHVTSLINKGTMFGNIESFKQIKEKLESRALELKSCVENILLKLLAEVERLEEAHQTSAHNDLTRELDDLGERIHICTQNLESMGPIDLAFFEEKNVNWNQTDELKELKIPRFIPKHLKEDDMKNLFGHLTFEETNSGREMTDDLTTILYTAPRPCSQERHSPRIPVPHTDRYQRRRLITASFGSIDNVKRVEMGICESPNQIIEFKSCLNILFQITYSEPLSRVFISGDKPTIYTYKNVFEVCDVEPKLEVLPVLRKPQGLAIGRNDNLIYSDGVNGVVEIESNVIDTIPNHSGLKFQPNTRIIFYKKGYTTWGIHCTKSGEILICLVPNFEGSNYAAVVKITLNIIHTKVCSECEFSRKPSGEPLFSNPRFVCENKVTSDICVSDFDNKVIVLSSSGDFRFSYTGNQPAFQNSKTFTPRGIACTGQGHILVADVENYLVHMLQSNGQFITHILSSTSPISWGICVDTVDRVWLVEEQNNEGGGKCLAKVKVFQIYN